MSETTTEGVDIGGNTPALRCPNCRSTEIYHFKIYPEVCARIIESPPQSDGEVLLWPEFVEGFHEFGLNDLDWEKVTADCTRCDYVGRLVDFEAKLRTDEYIDKLEAVIPAIEAALNDGLIFRDSKLRTALDRALIEVENERARMERQV